MGHRAGTESVRDIVKCARELNIGVLTLYAFSTENWKRPAIEVQGIMALLKTYLKSEARSMAENNVSLRCIGEQERLPTDIRKILAGVIRDTAPGTGEEPQLVLNLALSYGSRAEILRAARAMAEKCVSGQFEPADFTEKLFASHLYTGGLPDPDLLIRTGGEFRLSNFLLWQLSYAELYITETMWPDFKRERFVEALRYYQDRERRFGRTGEQLKAE